MVDNFSAGSRMTTRMTAKMERREARHKPNAWRCPGRSTPKYSTMSNSGLFRQGGSLYRNADCAKFRPRPFPLIQDQLRVHAVVGLHRLPVTILPVYSDLVSGCIWTEPNLSIAARLHEGGSEDTHYQHECCCSHINPPTNQVPASELD
jgi:hypothetical protein